MLDKLKFEWLIKYVEKIDDEDLIIEYAESHKLSSQQIYILATLLCKFKNSVALLQFAERHVSSNKNCLNMIGHAIYKTDDLYYMNAFVNKFPGLSINDSIINRMCELGNTTYLLNHLKSEFVSYETKRNIVATVITFGTYEQIDNLVHEYFDILTPDERKNIKIKVCDEKNGTLICNVSSCFDVNEKDEFVDAICSIDCIEKKHLFIQMNADLTEAQIRPVVLSICKSDDIQFIYKTLILLKKEYVNLRRMLLEKIKQIGDIKYLMLVTIYCDEEYLKNHLDYIETLYSNAILVDDIDEVFTSDELVDMYRHIQKVKSNKNNK